MPSPYDSPTSHHHETMNSARPPWLICAFATFVLIPTWFVVLLVVMSAIKPMDNPAGISIYIAACLFASIFVVPITSFAIAPALSRLSGTSNSRAAIVHSFAGAIMTAGLLAWPSVTSKLPSFDWTITLWYLCIFLAPPMLFGSFAYSLLNNARLSTENAG